MTAESFLGPGNGAVEYAEVLLVYLALFVVMLHGGRHIELSFRRTFIVLYVGWAGLVFPGNYLFYRLGIMSFLPWTNNLLHCFVWIGGCLGFLYATAYSLPLWHQVALFSIFSFIVKFAEWSILHTWEKTDFFGIQGHAAYLVGWSLMDGLYPFISMAGLRLVSRPISGLLVPGRDG